MKPLFLKGNFNVLVIHGHELYMVADATELVWAIAMKHWFVAKQKANIPAWAATDN